MLVATTRFGILVAIMGGESRAALGDKFDGDFCGIVSASERFVSDAASLQLSANGVDWFWNWDEESAFTPPGMKFAPMTYGMKTTPPSKSSPPTVDNYYDYPTYARHWGSLLSEYDFAKKPASNVNVAFGWNEPDTVGVCNENKNPHASKGECRKNEEGADITWCRFDAPDWQDRCPKTQGRKGPEDYEPDSWEYDRYWCCCAASGSGWWTPELVNVWRNETKGDRAGKPDRFGSEVVASWTGWAQAVRGAGYLLGSPSVAKHTGTWLRWIVDRVCPGQACPDYLVFHHYDQGCVDSPGVALEHKIEDCVDMIKKHPSIKGIMITELGLLTPDLHDNATKCENTIAYMKSIFGVFRRYAKYIAGVSWFSVTATGGVYDLSLTDLEGNLNEQGLSYMAECKGMRTLQTTASDSIVV